MKTHRVSLTKTNTPYFDLTLVDNSVDNSDLLDDDPSGSVLIIRLSFV